MISFFDHHKTLSDKGILLQANCTQSPDWGQLKFSELKQNHASDIKDVVREFAKAKLSEINQDQNRLFDSKTDILLSEFDELNNDKYRSYFGSVYLIDEHKPESGLISLKKEKMGRHLDLHISRNLFESNWHEILGIKLTDKDLKKLDREIAEQVSYMDEAEDGEGYIALRENLIRALQSTNKTYKAVTESVHHVMEPVLSQYKEHHVYLACPNTTWFDVDRGMFFPIIVGERIDGSCEISIFEAFN